MATLFEKHYSPIKENIEYLCKRFSHCKKVLEVGPGFEPFPLATHFVDHIKRDNLNNLVVMDITKDKLPYKDDEFDFAYCRHVLEDISDPIFVLEELIRVSKIVYIETPSPICEASRYIDGGSPYYRGYIHHRYIVWVGNDTIKFIPKYPIIEYINIPQYQQELSDPYYWNTYFVWNKERQGKPKIKLFIHDIDYKIHSNYEELVKAAVIESKGSINEYVSLINATKQELNYGEMLNWSHDLPTGSKSHFLRILDMLRGKNSKILEIGTYAGTSMINILKYLPDASGTTIDPWENYDDGDADANILKKVKDNNIEAIYHNNLKIANMIDRVTTIKGYSNYILIELLADRKSYDFIYIDGSHMCLDCYGDLVQAWGLLPIGGIIAIDDYLWNVMDNNILNFPYYGVKHFIKTYWSKLKILNDVNISSINDINDYDDATFYRIFLMKTAN